jgi:hypothetical protein
MISLSLSLIAYYLVLMSAPYLFSFSWTMRSKELISLLSSAISPSRCFFSCPTSLFSYLKAASSSSRMLSSSRPFRLAYRILAKSPSFSLERMLNKLISHFNESLSSWIYLSLSETWRYCAYNTEYMPSSW